jgi:hypothetical protein
MIFGIFLLDNILHHAPVMYVRCRHFVSRQQLYLRIRFYIFLVSEVLLAVVLGLGCIGVLLATFVLAPILGHLTFLDDLILVTGFFWIGTSTKGASTIFPTFTMMPSLLS